jgi:serine O-acetyltransferase
MSTTDPTAVAASPEGPPPPPGWSDPDPGRPLPFWRSLWRDVEAHVSPEDRPRSRPRWAWLALRIAAKSSGLRAVALYRLGHTLRGRLGPPGRFAAGVLFWVGRHFYGCALASSARIHGGLILPHPQGIVVGPGAVVGPDAWIYQNVTIGGSPGRAGMPRIGSNARLFAGAVLVGPITIGDHVLIGANAVVHRDVPSRRIVRAAPVCIDPLPPRLGGPTGSDE